MAVYEFFCPTCKERFEERRPMAQSDRPASCTSGHRAERLLSLFAVNRGGPALAEAAIDMGGGCCGGGGCACGN
jgi:putative FmdB family regulatory protein